MEKEIIYTDKAPAPIGPYSQGVKLSNGLIFCSGQIGIDAKTGKLKKGIAEQTSRAMKNMKEVVEQAGGTVEHVVKTTLFLADMRSYPEVNEIYSSFFPEDPPARSCVEVSGLPGDARIEIECIAEI